MRFSNRWFPTLSRQIAWLLAATVACAGSSAAPAVAAPAEGSDLLNRVKTVYRQSRRAIRSVEYDYTHDRNGQIRQARYARDGERLYLAGVYVLKNGVGMAKECSWDGQRVHDRWTPGRMNRTADRTQFSLTTPMPEFYLNMHVAWALGFESEVHTAFEPKDDRRYRFLSGRTVQDEDHGSCIELEFAAEWRDATLVARHAQRYAYAPVYYRFCDTAEGAIPAEEMTQVRYATVESEGNELHYPVQITLLASAGPGVDRTTIRWRLDEQTLKVNQPIPRSRFTLEPWPNEDVYDWDTSKLTDAKDPTWSPVGNVDFPWVDFVALYEKNRAKKKEERIAVAAAGGTPAVAAAAAAESARPWVESLGGWLALAGVVVVGGGGYVVYRRRHPRQATGRAE